jgi:hypothetical protein
MAVAPAGQDELRIEGFYVHPGHMDEHGVAGSGQRMCTAESEGIKLPIAEAGNMHISPTHQENQPGWVLARSTNLFKAMQFRS